MFPNSANVTLYLLAIVNKSDALGIRCPTINFKKEVIGCMKSITATEYQTSVALNVKSEIKISLQCFLYSGEKFVLLNGEIYKVDRTFQNGQFIELYLSLSDYKKEEILDATINR